MTDKELFKKINKEFNLKDDTILENTYNGGKYKKIISEIRGPQSPSLPSVPKVSGGGGFLSRVAAAIPGTRGHRMRSAEARKQEAQAKQEEVNARSAQATQMKLPGDKKSTTSRKYETWCKGKESQMKKKPLSITDQKLFDTHCSIKPGTPETPEKPGTSSPSKVVFKVGDEVIVKTTKNPKAEGKVTSILDNKPGFVQVVVKGAPPYAYDKRNVNLKRGINKENFEDIIKRYI